MDEIIDVMTHMRSHAQALEWATGAITPTTLLTNPDVLYFAMYDLYGQMYSTFHRSHGAYIFQHILSNYPVIAFDEFHLYNAKQIANAAFIMGTIKALAPRVPHVFIFSSATPQPLFKYYTTRPRKPPCFNRGDEWTYLLRRMGGGDSTLDVTSHSR